MQYILLPFNVLFVLPFKTFVILPIKLFLGDFTGGFRPFEILERIPQRFKDDMKRLGDETKSEPFFWGLYLYMHVMLVIPFLLYGFADIIIPIIEKVKPSFLENPEMFLPDEKFQACYLILLSIYTSYRKAEKLTNEEQSLDRHRGKTIALRWLITCIVLGFLSTLFPDHIVFPYEMLEVTQWVWGILLLGEGGEAIIRKKFTITPKA